MKYYIILLGTFFFLCCCNATYKIDVEQSVFDFDNWKNNILLDFNKMVEVDSIEGGRKSINKQMIKNEINIINTLIIKNNFERFIRKNKTKKWCYVYIIYHFLEGEYNQSLSSYVFFDGKKYWGMTYDHNNGRYYQVNKKYAEIITNIKPKLYGSGNGLAIISKIDRTLQNKNTVIVAGVSSTEELEPLMKIYEKKIFN